MLHTPQTNLLLLAAKQEQCKKAYLLTKNSEEFSGKRSEEWTSRQEKDGESNRTRQKNKKGDSKEESNDSHEIPDKKGRHQISLASLGGGGGRGLRKEPEQF